MIHCGTSYGHYKETREQLVHHPELRKQVRDIMAKLGKPLIIPEEIVHYSEWIHAMRFEIAKRRVFDLSNITVTLLTRPIITNSWPKMPFMIPISMVDSAPPLSPPSLRPSERQLPITPPGLTAAVLVSVTSWCSAISHARLPPAQNRAHERRSQP